jgi:hypothetical protein
MIQPFEHALFVTANERFLDGGERGYHCSLTALSIFLTSSILIVHAFREEDENGSGTLQRWASARPKDRLGVYSKRKRRGEVEAF